MSPGRGCDRIKINLTFTISWHHALSFTMSFTMSFTVSFTGGFAFLI